MPVSLNRIMLSGITVSTKQKKPISVAEDGSINVNITGGSSTSSGITSSGTSQAIRFSGFPSEAISAQGYTTSLDVSKFIALTFQCDFTGITSTPVVFHIEGTTDDSMGWVNLDSEESDTTRTTNGSYAFSIEKAPLYKIRLKYVSGAGSIMFKCVGFQYV